MNNLIKKIENNLSPECKVDLNSFSNAALLRISEHIDTLNSHRDNQYQISSLYKNTNKNNSEVIELTAKNKRNETKGISIII